MESTIHLDDSDQLKKESKKQSVVIQSQMGMTMRNSLEDNFLKEI